MKHDVQETKPKRSSSGHESEGFLFAAGKKDVWQSKEEGIDQNEGTAHEVSNEKTPLLNDIRSTSKPNRKRSKLRLVAQRLVAALTKSLKWVLYTLAAPGIYVVTCFYDEEGRFSPLLPIRRIRPTLPKRNGVNSTAHAIGLSRSSDQSDKATASDEAKRATRQRALAASEKVSGEALDSVSSATSESEGEPPEKRRTQIKDSELKEAAPTRRSIRIKLYSEDTARRRKGKKGPSSASNGTPSDAGQPAITAATLKSPTSPASSLRMTKYPRAPAPPRPLIPRRQPSYSLHTPSRSSSILPQKTLVIDLDETLIHSLAKGGRMSSGHMVEVKLNAAIGYGGTTIGPRHPILYYVHKRPHCDDFLRKVCKWYNLVVFTASVQEYADPVIDWLEQERKYFSARYYRQHCTFRNGAYIKDLSSVEPDLSKVMILDNSPLSYIFHEGKCSSCLPTRIVNAKLPLTDNAIPIEGWINDPTDNDLLHLIPLLEGLQYVTDVRALLALRRGETEASH